GVPADDALASRGGSVATLLRFRIRAAAARSRLGGRPPSRIFSLLRIDPVPRPQLFFGARKECRRPPVRAPNRIPVRPVTGPKRRVSSCREPKIGRRLFVRAKSHCTRFVTLESLIKTDMD